MHHAAGQDGVGEHSRRFEDGGFLLADAFHQALAGIEVLLGE